MADIRIDIVGNGSSGQAAVQSLLTSLSSLTSALSKLTAETTRNTSALAANGAKLSDVASKARQAGASFQGAVGAARGFASSLTSIKTAILSLGLARLGEDIVNTTVRMEGIRRGLVAVEGGSYAGAQQMQVLRQVTDQVGFRTLDVGRSFLRLTAATRGTNLEGAKTVALFTQLSRAIALYGGTSSELDGALQAFMQMASKGVVQMEELRGQLGDRLPGALQIAARAYGVTTARLVDMIRSGGVPASEFIEKFTNQLGREIPQNITTANAAFARFQNRLDEAKVQFANSGFMDGLIEGMQSLTQELQNPETQSALRSIGKAIGDLVAFMAAHARTILTFIAAFAGFRILTAVGSAFAALVPIIGGVVTAIRDLSLAMVSTPIGLFITAALALAAAFGLLDAATASESQAQREYKDATDRAVESTDALHRLISDPTAPRAAVQHALAQAQANLEQARTARIAAAAEAAKWAAAARTRYQMMQDSARYSAHDAGDPGRAAAAGQAMGNRDAAQANVAEQDRRIAEAERIAADAQRRVNEIPEHPNSAGTGITGGGGGGGGRGGHGRGGHGGGGGGGMSDAQRSAQQYRQELERLRNSINEVGLSERDLAAVQALESAGLHRNINATDEHSRAVIEQARALYDAQKRHEDATRAVEMDRDATRALEDAQQKLLEVTQPGVAAIVQERHELERRYDDRVREIQGMQLEADVRERLLRLAREEKQAAEDALAVRARTQFGERYDEQWRRVEDAALDHRQITDPTGADMERRRLEINRRRKDALRQLAQNYAENSDEYHQLREAIDRAYNQEVQNLIDERKVERARTLAQDISTLLKDAFENPRQAMIKFFTELLTQIATAIIQTAILGDKMGALGGNSGNGVVGFLTRMVTNAIGFGGGKSRGNAIMGNTAYLTGEQGPEIFIPNASGTMIPNNMLRGGAGNGVNMSLGNTYITVNNAAGLTADELSTSFAKRQERMMRDVARDTYQKMNR